MTNFLPLSGLPQVAGQLEDAGAPEGFELLCRFFCLPGEREQVEPLARFMFSSYITVPVYENFYRWLGHGEKIDEMVAAWAAKDRQRAAEVAPWDLIEDTFIFGSPEEMKARLDAYVEGGITLPVVTPITTPGQGRRADRGAGAVESSHGLGCNRHRRRHLLHRRAALARGRDPGGRAAAERQPPELAGGIAPPHRAGALGGGSTHHEPLVRRLRDAAPLRDRRRQGLLREPLPAEQGLPRCRGDGRDHLPRVRDRSLPQSLPAGLLAVLAEALRQRQRQPDPARRALHHDDRDADPGRVRRRDAGDSWASHTRCRDADDGPSSPRPRHRRDAQLRRQGRRAKQLSLLPAATRRRGPRGARQAGGEGAGLHALVRADRALVRARRVPATSSTRSRSRSAAGPTSRTTAGSPSWARGSR